MSLAAARGAAWPPLPWAEWEQTHAALHRWLQLVGKLKLATLPWINHSWHVTFALTARGLTTGPLPWAGRFYEADFDFVADRLRLVTNAGASAFVPLEAQSLALFHARVREALASLDAPMAIRTLPCEIADAVPFEQDTAARPYDADAVRRYCCRPSACCASSARVSRARRARCISSGARPISPSRASRGGARPHIRVACRIWRTGSCARRTPTR
jgi:hypothetical protein